ncbi:hypothetical protein KDM87_02190 [Undibacterium sp. FT147W]|uniref:DRBM domain-containing protein n=1 Tax=Undibacterium rivi TaxID=2828729 RepID=A0ABS5GZ16_9BURK|nr:hypothetical protein [Undibacterium rivi]MBR7791389.1 hypothetical protein [Undibacterium rivi]
MSLDGFSCEAAAYAQVNVFLPDETNLLASGGAEVSESQVNQASAKALLAHYLVAKE